MTDNFESGPIDPRIYKELATDMWYVTVSYLPIKDILNLPLVCKYFNEVVVWGKWSGRLMWEEMGAGTIDEKIFEVWIDTPHDSILSHACRLEWPVSHIKCLLNGGANVNISDNGITPLYLACWRGHEDIVRTLLEANANPNIADADGWSPLMRVIVDNNSTIISMLINAGANINHTDVSNWSVLMFAVWKNNEEVVKILLDKNADINVRTLDGRTAIGLASNCSIIYQVLKRIN